MQYPRFAVRAHATVVLATVAALVSVGCSGERSTAGPRLGDPLPVDPDIGQDGPVDLQYVCGNRFLVVNAYTVPISVAYRVAGGGEEGTAEVSAAASEDPPVSETMIETRTQGTVELFHNGKPVVARANDGVPCTPAPAAPAFVGAALTASEGGEWTPQFSWPITAVHMILLPSGRVLSIPRLGTPRVWDPATGDFTFSSAPVWLFCAGHTLLSDGTVLLAGGHITDGHGLSDITLFTDAGGWSSGTPMARGRWYPTTTTMGNGDVVILAGRDEAGNVATLPEVWSNGSIRQLTGASKTLPYYPRAFVAPDGRLYIGGPGQVTRFLYNISTSGKWKSGPPMKMARDYGSVVMYDNGKILAAGGGRTTNTAELIDLNQAAPSWSFTGSMTFARRHHNVTVLPTGEVIATAGVAGTSFNDLTQPVYPAEIWNPVTGQWTVVASSAVPRGYHASALLLPDGRVLLAGSGEGKKAPAQKNAEIFSPPYLFNPDGTPATRPVITSAPSSALYAEQFRIETPDAQAITNVSLIRLGAVTHAFDQNQRFQRLAFTADQTGLTVTAPLSGNLAPPGHYMVFILDGADTPSVGKIIRIH